MALTPNNQIEAILAGEDIPVSSRQLAFIKEAIQNGGSSDTYETVAEIEVGEMEHMTGMYYATTEIPFPAISDTETYYLNDSENPNDGFYYDNGEVDGILWNCEIVDNQFVPLDSSKPYVFIGTNNDTIGIGSNTNDLENKTVTILKKASAPSGGSDRLVVTLEYVEYESEGETRHEWRSDKSYTEIKAALDAKKDVEVLYPYDFDGALTDPMFIHLYPFGYIEAIGSMSFNSSPFDRGNDTPAYLAALCLWDPDHDETGWEFQWYKIAQSAEFEFSVTSDGQGGFTVTPATGVTYAAILEAIGSTPLVFAKISVPALNKTVIARFSGIDSGSTGILTATVVEYLNGAYCVMALDVYSDERMVVTIKPIPSQS